MKTGFDPAQWEAAKTEMLQALTEKASLLQMITYGDLAREIKAVRFEASDPDMWYMLGEISEEEEKAGRGLLSAIVVHKGRDWEPGSGFFEIAARNGRDMSDREKCWVAELHRVQGYWKTRKSP
jgi:hypothetical protein